MSALEGLLAVSLVCAFASVATGRNLTRSLVAGHAALGALVIALILAGVGVLGLVLGVLGGLTLGTIQLYGWMLVDVDRDHLPPTDTPTRIARGLAFLLLGGGLLLLVAQATSTGALDGSGGAPRFARPDEIGALFFGPMWELAILTGVTLAAGLLTTLLLTRKQDEGE